MIDVARTGYETKAIEQSFAKRHECKRWRVHKKQIFSLPIGFYSSNSTNCICFGVLKAVQKKCTFYRYGLNLAASNKCRLRSARDIILQIVPYAMQRVVSKQKI